MEEKAFELGVLVGRFQTLHTGHAYMIAKAVQLCRRVGIFVGSSQESGTAKNPYDYETRERMLRRLCPEAEVFPLPDIGVGNNSVWGDYVLSNIVERFGREPDLMISGKEDRRSGWFDSARGLNAAELYVPKVIDISATEMRGFMINNDLEQWRKYTPQVLWEEYEMLRSAVLTSMHNTETASM